MRRIAAVAVACWLAAGIPTGAGAGDETLIPFGPAESPSAELAIGDGIARVIEALGDPQGRVRSGDTEVLYYARGTVTLANGKVAAMSLVSPEEAQVRREQREAASARRASERAAAAAARREKGIAEREAKNADARFRALPASTRLEQWIEFQRRYPEVRVDDEIAAARKDADAAAAQPKPGEKGAKSEREQVAEKIAADEKELESLRNAQGLGRTRLVEARKRMAELRKELETLRARLQQLPEK